MDMNISSIPTCVASGKSKADDYLSAPYVKEMLSMGYVVRVVTAPRDLSKNALRSIYEIAHTKKNQSVPTKTDKEFECCPSLFYINTSEGRRYFNRGDVVNGLSVRSSAKIRWGSQGKSKNSIETKPAMRKEGWKLFNVFINHRTYKLDVGSIVSFMSDKDCKSIVLIGSGGSCLRAGGSGQDIKSAFSSEQVIGRLSNDQQMENSMNMTLGDAALNNRVIAIFLGAETYNYLIKSPTLARLSLPRIDDKDHYFLGYFEVNHFESTRPKPLKKIKEEEFERSLLRQGNKRWAEGRAMSVICTLIPDSLLENLPMLCPRRGELVNKHNLKEVCVVDSPVNQIQVPVEKEYLTKVLSCEEENTVLKGESMHGRF